MAGQGRTVLGSRFVAVTFHTGKVQQQGESGGPFNECADRGAPESEDEISRDNDQGIERSLELSL
jgi:hypothetical protein